MTPTRTRTLSYAELDRLTPEILPERLLLSTALPRGGDGSGTTTIVYACQATYSSGTTGLLGTGLLAQPASSTLTCVPGTVVHQD
ncbi:hypothetical protein [Actinomadura sp. 6K520]|jgi:hypothetical protein|uniref:hypothetical protein n=1 Tax=Actinomadura sp. 6K520 TaxID=2530364 RepID=UPI00104944F7|nr:hypothetical protein [Actinomadura sp. 6K520]TDE38698.1 hypothetical protein E1289_01670 [Actinomadura sp. 6K520]